MRQDDDQETQQILSEGEELLNMTYSRGWAIARERLVNRIMDLQSVLNVDDDPASIANILADIKGRKMAIDVLKAFLLDIEGSAAQHQANVDMANKNPHLKDDGTYIDTQ